MLSTAAHEFFHSWNVERIRPRSLEPFKLDAPNPSGELWFAEGFTSYYEPLTLHRAGLSDIGRLASRLGSTLGTVIGSPARKYRSAEEVSRLAQFVDQASWSDPTNFENGFLSYYTWGAAIGLGLDLSLRARTDHKVTLDDYMRRLWRDYGRLKAPAEGSVARPYTIQDLRDVLADVSGDRSFANEFFDRYVQGREVVDYEPLLARAGLAAAEEQAWARMDRSCSSGLQGRFRARQRADDRGYAGVRRGTQSRRRTAIVRRCGRLRARPARRRAAAPETGRPRPPVDPPARRHAGAHDRRRRGSAPADRAGRRHRPPADGSGTSFSRGMAGLEAVEAAGFWL